MEDGQSTLAKGLVPLRRRSPLPSLEGAAEWVNGEPKPEERRGFPVFVPVWSITCHLCHNAAEQLKVWRERFGKEGMIFIAIHQPRSETELDVEAVRKDALEEMGFTQPCAIDNKHTIVERFGNQFVPAYYVFDRAHQLRHFQAGDKGYDRIESAIERILHEEPQPLAH